MAPGHESQFLVTVWRDLCAPDHHVRWRKLHLLVALSGAVTRLQLQTGQPCQKGGILKHPTVTLWKGGVMSQPTWCFLQQETGQEVRVHCGRKWSQALGGGTFQRNGMGLFGEEFF